MVSILKFLNCYNKSMKKQMLLAVCALTLIVAAARAANKQEDKPVNTISPAAALEMLGKEEAVIVDVRTPEEVEDFDLSYTIKIPLAALPDKMDALPSGKTIITVCASGMRAQNASGLLIKKGFKSKYISGPITSLPKAK